MNPSRRRRLALRVLAVMIGLGALAAGGVAFAADSSSSTGTVIAPASSTTSGYAVPSETIWS